MEANSSNERRMFYGTSPSMENSSRESSSETCIIEEERKNIWLYDKTITPMAFRPSLPQKDQGKREKLMPGVSVKARLGLYTRDLSARLGVDIADVERPT